MITKQIAGRKDGRSSTSDALRYGEGLKANRETGEFLDKSHRTRLGNFGLVDDGVYSGLDVAEMTELIGLAATEMQSNCDLNTRVAQDKQLVHFVFSYNQEKPTEAVLRDTEDSALAALGLDKNHFATMLHNDNGYWHLHIFASRIEKEKPHRCNALWHDQIKRDKVCREIEIRHYLQRDNGLHQIDEHGQIVEIPRDERRAKRDAKPSGISDRAKTIEIYSGEKSFQTWANEIRIGDRLKHAKNWQDLHSAAAAYGCEVKGKGAGFIICPTGEKGGIQLSKVGLKNLLDKFGAFQVANGNQVQPETAYKPEPTNTKASSHYERWSDAKAAFKPVKTDLINVQREMHKQIRKDLRAKHKSELEKIRANAKGQERLIAVSVAKMEHAISLTQLADRLAHDRKKLHQQLTEQGPGNTFRDYLVKEASNGDDAALVLAQKYGTDSATEVLRKRESDQLQIVATASGQEHRSMLRINFSHRVERNGTVVFNLGHGRIVTDSAISKQIQLNHSAATDPDAIATSLRFAQAKFGNALTLTGSPEFQRLAVETAVRKGLSVTFKDPELEAYKQQFVNSTRTNNQEKTHVICRTQQNQAQRIPPANRRDRLHNLSELTLDSKAKTPAMLLPKDVPGDLAVRNGRERDDRGLRRTGTSAGGRADTIHTDAPSTGAAGPIHRTTINAAGPNNGSHAPTYAGNGIVQSGSSSAGGDSAAPSERIDLLVATFEEWLAANPHMVENTTPSLVKGRVLHVLPDGRWLLHLGRDQFTVRQPDVLELKTGQMVSLDKNGKASIVSDKGKGRAD